MLPLQGMLVVTLEHAIAAPFCTRQLADRWTVVTADGSMSAHFEHTVAITEDGPCVLTVP